VLAAPPKLRGDLTVSQQQAAGATVCVVKDPVSGKFFRFGELEQFIADQLDGETPLDMVRQRTEEAFRATLPAQTLTAFIKSLEKGGLLETEETTERGKARAGRPGRIRGSLLYLRFPFFDPDRLFNRLVHRLRFCFTPQFLVLSAALILLATGTTIVQWSDVSQDLARLYHLSAIPLFLVVSFVVASAHEFAHGLTCKRFGGEVHELGFLLIYFTPAFYTNVSDAWLFPEKAKRLWVGFAGPYFELFLWALATLAWRLTDVETTVNYVALMVMTLSGIKTLFNLNPFIKLDGYYLLSDYLELPNLRQKAFRHVGGLAKRLFGVGERIAADLSRRERWVYLAYGLVGSLVSLSLLGYVLATTGGYLIENHQPLPLLLLTSLAGVRSRRKLRRLFRGSPDPLDPSDDGDDIVPPPPADASAPTEPTKPRGKNRRRARWRPRAWWMALGAAALAFVFFGRMQLRIGGAVTVLPEANADVRAEVEGLVEDIAVDEGDEVRAGDVIARLANHALVADLRKTEASIRETRAVLKKLEVGPTAEELAVATAGVSKAEDQLRYAQNSVTRLGQLVETAAATRQELEAAQQQATAAENDLADARAKLDLLRRRNRPEDIEASRARLASLETQQRFLDGEVRELTVVSPTTGIVATPSRQLTAMVGQLVSRGALIAKVYGINTVAAQIVVSEKEIADVRVVQPVALRVRAYPDVAFHGTVTAVATEGTPTPGAEATAAGGSAGSGAGPGRTFLVTTQIDNHSLLLKPGMTGQGKIYGGQRRIIGLITRRLARTFKVEFWSWW
jgi:putative peptide zinc metalloprotease protein